MKVTVGEEDSGRSVVPSKRISGKRWSLYILSCLLLLVAAIGIAVGAASRKSPATRISSEAQAILRSACSSTLHPNLCVSAVATRPGVADSLFTHKNVIQASLNITTQIVEHNYFAITKLAAKRRGTLTERERAAFLDCLEMVNETLSELRIAAEDLKGYPNAKKSLAQHADDISTLLSASITNQETCLDGFSSAPADENLREAVLGKEENAEHMCSNALAMFKNMSDTDMAAAGAEKRRLDAAEGEGGWPGWLSSGDRRLLQSPPEAADTVVAADGSGNHRTVSAAVEAAPKKSRRRYVIRIKAGVYRENVVVPKSKTNIMFLGDGRNATVITASQNVVDGSTTFHSATVAVVGPGFLARGVTFQNTAGPSKHQAVALRVGSDLSAFYQCDMLAYQDTLYVHSNRQFYINCLIAGTVDFIFGNAAAVFQDCDIHARRPNADQKNMVTAQSRSDPNQNTGIVIQKCRIGATPELEAVRGSVRTFLGRPWKQYSRTVVMQTAIEDVIAAEGWHEWNGSFALDTLYYGEYRNRGAGAPTTNRVKWKGFHVITSAAVAQGFTTERFIGGGSWLSGTGFPDSLGL